MPSPLTRGAPAIVVLGLLVGCGSPSASVEPTIPERPAVPDGWRDVTSDAGDVRLALPADLDMIFTGSGIVAQRGMPEQARLEVLAVGPAAVFPQPRTGEQVRTWLTDQLWVPVAGEGGVVELADASEREVVLPAGRALEVAMTASSGSPDGEGRIMVYAIATEGGLAILRFVGSPAAMNEREDELRLIALLAQFGDLDDPS